MKPTNKSKNLRTDIFYYISHYVYANVIHQSFGDISNQCNESMVNRCRELLWRRTVLDDIRVQIKSMTEFQMGQRWGV